MNTLHDSRLSEKWRTKNKPLSSVIFQQVFSICHSQKDWAKQYYCSSTVVLLRNIKRFHVSSATLFSLKYVFLHADEGNAYCWDIERVQKTFTTPLCNRRLRKQITWTIIPAHVTLITTQQWAFSHNFLVTHMNMTSFEIILVSVLL